MKLNILLMVCTVLTVILLSSCGAGGGAGAGSGGGGGSVAGAIGATDPAAAVPGTADSTTAIVTTPPATDGTFNSYIRQFENDAARYGRTINTSNLVVSFGSTAHRGSNVIGYCQFLSGGVSSVVISPSWWATASNTAREVALYHEFGHCVLYRAHLTDYDPVLWVPKSIMFPYLQSNSTYQAYWANYIQELFTVTLPSIVPSGSAGLEEVHDGRHVCNLEVHQ